MGRHGTSRVAKAVLLSAIPPLMLKTDANPEGLPLSAFDEIRAGVAGDRSQYDKDLSEPFYGANRPGSSEEHAEQLGIDLVACGPPTSVERGNDDGSIGGEFSRPGDLNLPSLRTSKLP